ncbi:MAG: DUF6268 family outer membrane beta-barrel protein, partial [Bacteroidota bacterium]
VFSQNYVDLLKVNASTTPSNTFDGSSSKSKLNEVLVDLTLPIKINEKLSVLSGIIYENIQTKLFAESDIKKFGSTTLKLGINKQLNDNLTLTAVLLPKISSDYQSIGGEDFQLGAIALFRIKKHENKNFKVGLYANSDLFGLFFVPMFGMYYLSPTKKFETTILLPLQADANYKISPFLNIGANFNGQIRSYHLTDITPSNKSTYVGRSTSELFGYLKFNLTKSISIQTKIGRSFGRTYEVYDKNDKVSFGLPAIFIGDKRNQLNTNFSDGLIFQTVLLYRLSLDGK